jgi:hypothetical protein
VWIEIYKTNTANGTNRTFYIDDVTLRLSTSAGVLSGNLMQFLGNYIINFVSTVAGGTWSSSNPTVASVNSSTGVVIGGTFSNHYPYRGRRYNWLHAANSH